jgi:hypothetical protein
MIVIRTIIKRKINHHLLGCILGSWSRIEVKEECYLDPGAGWESRYDQTCVKIWPSPRAGHATVLDPKRNLMWLFGGYTTYYPYLSTDGYGSGE